MGPRRYFVYNPAQARQQEEISPPPPRVYLLSISRSAVMQRKAIDQITSQQQPGTLKQDRTKRIPSASPAGGLLAPSRGRPCLLPTKRDGLFPSSKRYDDASASVHGTPSTIQIPRQASVGRAQEVHPNHYSIPVHLVNPKSCCRTPNRREWK